MFNVTVLNFSIELKNVGHQGSCSKLNYKIDNAVLQGLKHFLFSKKTVIFSS